LAKVNGDLSAVKAEATKMEKECRLAKSKLEAMSIELKDVKQQRDTILETIKKKSSYEEKYYEKIQQVEKLKEV